MSWFEEPVSSDDLEGLRLLRDRAPAGMDIAAVNMATTCPIFAACWQPGPSMFCKPTPRGVRESQVQGRVKWGIRRLKHARREWLAKRNSCGIR